uniref:Uncharacterized protein n=1 Tax=Arundo donax TaxID=35708 RepID=A0A0A8Y714_ARUDO
MADKRIDNLLSIPFAEGT